MAVPQLWGLPRAVGSPLPTLRSTDGYGQSHTYRVYGLRGATGTRRAVPLSTLQIQRNEVTNMTHEHRTWSCWVCAEQQTTMSYPKPQVCDKCLGGLAGRLCATKLGAPLETEGVDKAYWREEARTIAAVLFRRRPPVFVHGVKTSRT